MDTVKDSEKKEWHVGCGGTVIRGVCVKCGEKKKGLMSRVFGDDPIIMRENTEKKKREEHKRRIREGRDIFKE
jgi:hypothetical protein